MHSPAIDGRHTRRPQPQGDAAKARAPAKGTGFRPEIDDEVLLGVKGP